MDEIYSRKFQVLNHRISCKNPWQAMDRQNDPIPISYHDQTSGAVYSIRAFCIMVIQILFGKLQWLPLSGNFQCSQLYVYFHWDSWDLTPFETAKNDNIWVGMAQRNSSSTGYTCFSALMGWVDRIKAYIQKNQILLSKKWNLI